MIITMLSRLPHKGVVLHRRLQVEHASHSTILACHAVPTLSSACLCLQGPSISSTGTGSTALHTT